MKIRFTLLLLFLIQFSLNRLDAQPIQGNNARLSLKSNKSILFGYDTYLNAQPLQNQRNVVICSALNGWLYAAYSYYNDSLNQGAVTILQSKDNGVNWLVILDGPIGTYKEITHLDILACGNDSASLKVFVGYCTFTRTTTNHYANVVRYNGNTGVFEAQLIDEFSSSVRDLALASDNLYPASNSNPFSIGIVYSKRKGTRDSIVFYSSSNGGMSMDSHYNIASTSHYFGKVALTYGRSPSSNTGRYFAAWEEKENESSTYGHIYTAYSEPNFNSTFTASVLLDTLDASASNNVRNPSIACQNNSADNDSSNLTEVVLFEKYSPVTQKFNIAGFYNKTATASNNFHKFTIDPSTNNKIQPDICFNAFDSTFIVTYFDSTTQKLPYYVHDFNMTDPDAWLGLSGGYNDDNNLVAPHPQVVMDFGKQKGANAWIGDRVGGNGAAMFDTPFTYYTGIFEKNSDRNNLKVKIFPNPASESTTLEFELSKSENVKVELMNLVGQPLTNHTFPSCPSGKKQLKIDVTKYSAGLYILTIQAGDSFSSEKLSVTK